MGDPSSLIDNAISASPGIAALCWIAKMWFDDKKSARELTAKEMAVAKVNGERYTLKSDCNDRMHELQESVAEIREDVRIGFPALHEKINATTEGVQYIMGMLEGGRR